MFQKEAPAFSLELRFLLIKSRNSCLRFCGINYHPAVEGIDLVGLKPLGLTLTYTKALLQCKGPVCQYKAKLVVSFDYTMVSVAICLLFK